MTRPLLWSVAALALLGAAGLQQEPEDSRPNDIPDDMQDFREHLVGANTPQEARQEAALEEAGTGGAGFGVEPAPPEQAPPQEAPLAAPGPQEEPEDSKPNDIPDDMQDFREHPVGSDTPGEARRAAALEEAGTGGAGAGEAQPPPNGDVGEDAEAQPPDTGRERPGQEPRPEAR